jgi:hypothetical protein
LVLQIGTTSHSAAAEGKWHKFASRQLSHEDAETLRRKVMNEPFQLSLGEAPHSKRVIELVFPDRPETDRVDITLIESVEWLCQHGAVEGGNLFLDLPEFRFRGEARVVRIRPCLPLTEGEGRPVTGWFKQARGNRCQVRLGGHEEMIGITWSHPVWSVDRMAWVPAGELFKGERVQGKDGPLVVESFTKREKEEPVYNIEVDGDHCYRVGEGGLLVHNASASQDAMKGESVLKGLGCCPVETLKGVSLYATFMSKAGLGVVYILRKKSDRTILKAGKTATGSEPGRWGKYVYANTNCAEFDIVAWAFDESCVTSQGRTLNTAESAIRSAFCGTYPPDCPWDNAQIVGVGYRLGRSGPGTPGEDPQGSTTGQWNGCQWIPGPNAPPTPSRRPSRQDFEQQLDTFAAQFGGRNARGINTALANDYGVAASTITLWRQTWGL